MINLIKKTPKRSKFKPKLFFAELYNNKSIYIMALPAIVLLFIFAYIPLFGLVMAFKNFTFDKGIFGSDWAKPIFSNFTFLFSSSAALRAVKNTILLNLAFISTGAICEVALALMINEIKNRVVKKVTQSLTLLPFFLSWIIVGVFVYNVLTSNNSSFNSLIASFGLPKINFLSNAAIWPLTLILITRWKSTGYGSIVYLATLTGIDSTYYEAAKIDGASKLQQLWSISLPLLLPTVFVLVLLQIGHVFNADFGMFYFVLNDNPMLYSTTDVIDVFVYRSLRLTGDVGMASAAGFSQSVLSFICLVAFNQLARKIAPDSSLF